MRVLVTGGAGFIGSHLADAFLARGDEWWVNEINTIPGSMARYLWVQDCEVPFATLLEGMLDEAARTPTAVWDATGADGSALRSAGSIEGKLG